MSVVQTILVFLVIPTVAVAVMSLLIFGRSGARAPRYRPGRDWPHEPVWYAPHPLAIRDEAHGSHDVSSADVSSAEHLALPSGSSGLPDAPTAAGGARGTW